MRKLRITIEAITAAALVTVIAFFHLASSIKPFRATILDWRIFVIGLGQIGYCEESMNGIVERRFDLGPLGVFDTTLDPTVVAVTWVSLIATLLIYSLTTGSGHALSRFLRNSCFIHTAFSAPCTCRF